MLQLREVSPTDPEIVKMVSDLDEFLDGLYPAEDNFLVSVDDLKALDSVTVGAYWQDRLIGMGSVCFFKDFAEIKRMYILPAFRGKKISPILLQHLETIVGNRGVNLIRLETGQLQAPALKLYESSGYQETGPFGDYPENPSSIFMEKRT